MIAVDLRSCRCCRGDRGMTMPARPSSGWLLFAGCCRAAAPVHRGADRRLPGDLRSSASKAASSSHDLNLSNYADFLRQLDLCRHLSRNLAAVLAGRAAFDRSLAIRSPGSSGGSRAPALCPAPARGRAALHELHRQALHVALRARAERPAQPDAGRHRAFSKRRARSSSSTSAPS